MDNIIIRKAKREDCKAIRNLIQVNLMLHVLYFLFIVINFCFVFNFVLGTS